MQRRNVQIRRTVVSVFVSLALASVCVIGASTARSATVLNDWTLGVFAPHDGATAYDADSIRFAWVMTNHSFGGRVDIAAQADDVSMATGQHYHVKKNGEMALDVAGSQIGLGDWYWRACTEDSDGTTEHCTPPRRFTIAAAPPGYDPTMTDYCNDGYNNDEDPLRDERDPGCRDNSPRTEVTSSLPRMSLKEGRSAGKFALYGEFGEQIEAGYHFRFKCGRTGRARFRCWSSWLVGDLVYQGKVNLKFVWLPIFGEFPQSRYRMRITELNAYCFDTGGRKCVKVYKRSGSA